MPRINSNPRREAKVYLERNMVEGRLHRIGLGEAIIHSSRASDKETVNDNAAALVPFNNTSGVLAIDELKSAINDTARADNDLREAILNGIERANQAVSALGTGAATTLAVVEATRSNRSHLSCRRFHDLSYWAEGQDQIANHFALAGRLCRTHRTIGRNRGNAPRGQASGFQHHRFQWICTLKLDRRQNSCQEIHS